MSSYLNSAFGPKSPLRKAASGIFGYTGEGGEVRSASHEVTSWGKAYLGINHLFRSSQTPPPTYSEDDLKQADELSGKVAAAPGTPMGKRRRKSDGTLEGTLEARDKSVVTPAGETFCTQEHPLTEPPASMFRLRVGPDYRRNGKKEPSGPALFKVEAIDLVTTETQGVKNPVSHFEPILNETGVAGTNVPPNFIVHANMPKENPGMWGNPETAAR